MKCVCINSWLGSIIPLSRRSHLSKLINLYGHDTKLVYSELMYRTCKNSLLAMTSMKKEKETLNSHSASSSSTEKPRSWHWAAHSGKFAYPPLNNFPRLHPCTEPSSIEISPLLWSRSLWLLVIPDESPVLETYL